MDDKQSALEVYENVIQNDPNNIECLKHLAKLATEMRLPAKADHYQRMYTELTDRIDQMQREQQYDTDQPIEQYQNYDNPAPFKSEEMVEAPSLQVNGIDTPSVGKVKASEQAADIWEGVDIDL